MEVGEEKRIEGTEATEGLLQQEEPTKRLCRRGANVLTVSVKKKVKYRTVTVPY